MTPRSNLFIGAAGFVGSLTLPELAATCAGFATAAWMLTQAVIAIRKAKRSGCSRANCPKRTEG